MAVVPDPILPGTSPPLLISHAGGNSAAATEAALGSGADYIEIDLWVHRGRFEARHERRLPFGLPARYEKWYLSRLPGDRDPLGSMLASCRGRSGLFLDIKTAGERPSKIVSRKLAEAEVTVPIGVSSQSWGALRAVAREAPSLAVYYSVDVRAKLDLLFSVTQHDTLPAGTSCRHSLLSRDVVARLHDRGLSVIAWTVDDEARALELAAMGVDAITTHRIGELRAALAHAR